MCGRYSLIAELSQLALRFNFNLGELLAPPRYNGRPYPAGLDGHQSGPGGWRRGGGKPGRVYALGADTLLEQKRPRQPLD